MQPEIQNQAAATEPLETEALQAQQNQQFLDELEPVDEGYDDIWPEEEDVPENHQ